MHNCKLFSKKSFQKLFPWLIPRKVYPSLCKFSNRMMTSGLNNEQSKTVERSIHLYANFQIE